MQSTPYARRRWITLAAVIGVLALVGGAHAANAPVYRDSSGSAQGANGVVIVNADGTFAGAANPQSVTCVSGCASTGVAQASTTSGQTGSLIQGAATNAAPTYGNGTTNPINLNLSGAIRVDGSGVTQPVSDGGGSLTVDCAGSACATATGLTTINSTLGSPFQAGGSIGNTSFGVSGTLPAYAAVPTFKVDQTTPGTTNLVQITDGSGAVTVDGTVAVTQSGAWLDGVKGVDGSTIATAANPFPVNVGDSAPFSGSSAAAADLVLIDTTGRNYIVFGFTSIGSGKTATVTSSNDGTPGTGGTFRATPCFETQGLLGSATASAISLNTATSFMCPVTGTTMKISVTVAGSGTATVAGAAKSGAMPNTWPLQYVAAQGNGIVSQGAGTSGSAAGGVASVQGPNAQAATATANPVVTGCVGVTANPTAVATGQAAKCIATVTGVVIAKPYSIPEGEWTNTITLTDGTSTALNASCGAGLRNYVTWWHWSSLSATVATTITFLDGATVKGSSNVPAGASNFGMPLPTPWRGGTATAFNAQASGVPVGSITVEAGGYCAP